MSKHDPSNVIALHGHYTPQPEVREPMCLDCREWTMDNLDSLIRFLDTVIECPNDPRNIDFVSLRNLAGKALRIITAAEERGW